MVSARTQRDALVEWLFAELTRVPSSVGSLVSRAEWAADDLEAPPEGLRGWAEKHGAPTRARVRLALMRLKGQGRAVTRPGVGVWYAVAIERARGGAL